MRYLGRTGLRVSALSFGVMTFGGATAGDGARRQVDMCLDAGVNLFDTADVYGHGTSEEILGAALGGRRADVLVATKLHAPMGGPNDMGQSRHHIARSCEASLRRMGTDWIDLLQVHGFDARTDLHQSLRALDDLVRAGTVRYIGCSNHSAWQLMKALGVSDGRGLERYSALQAYYSLVGRELEFELVPLCLDQGVGILVWSPLAGGFLAGGRGGRERVPGGLGDERAARATAAAIAEIAGERGATPPQVALNWVLAKPGVTSAIVGARTDEQLADNLAAAAWSLGAEEVERLDEASAVRVPYPQWHQRRDNAERLPGPE